MVGVTDHAVERFRQRVAQRRGDLDTRAEIIARVSRAWAAGRVSDPPPEIEAPRGTVEVSDLVDRDVMFVCRHDKPRGELIVVTLWERGRVGDPRVPKQYTDELRRQISREPRRP